MKYKTNPWVIVLTVIITIVIVVGGYYLLSQKQITNVTIPTTTQSSNDTNSKKTQEVYKPSKIKKTYTSSANAISFKYPSDWTVYEDKMFIDVQPPNEALLPWSNYFTLDIYQHPFSAKNTLEELRKDFKEKNPELKETIFTISDKKAYLWDFEPKENSLLYLYFSYNDKIYNVHFFEEWYEKMPDIKEMIESLHFKEN